MDILDPRDQLICQEKNGLQGEPAIAEVEEILQGGAKQVQNHGIILTLGADPTDERDTYTTSNRPVHAGLVFQLRVPRLDGLEFEGKFLAGYNARF